MGAITGLDDVVSLVTDGGAVAAEPIFFYKTARVGAAAAATPIAIRFISLWQYEGFPASGNAPGAVAIPDNTTDGSFKQADPGGGRTKWMLSLGMNGFALGTLLLYDRLLHQSNLDATLTTSQTVGGTITRNTGGVGNQIWVEIYTQIGASSAILTVTYTNEAGTSGRTTTVNIGNTGLREAQRILPVSLAQGDKGVRSVQSVQLNVTTGTAGAFGITIVRPIASVPLASAAGYQKNMYFDFPCIQSIDVGACLAMIYWCLTTPAIEFFGNELNVEK